MNKKTLRSVYLSKRIGLSDSEYSNRNHQLTAHVLTFLKQYKPHRNIHIFLSMEEQKEPLTAEILTFLWAQNHQQVFSSKTHFAERKLSHHIVSGMDNIQRDERGIPYPATEAHYPAKTMDLVFVPLISFDKHGHRIGYGAGLYDRFLSELRPGCLKVGLALTPPLDKIRFTEAHDIPLDACITHLGIYNF